VLGDKHLKTVENVLLSNLTVSRRIKDIGCNIECELINWINESEGFGMKLDESTDVAGLSVLLVFMRYMHNTHVEEEMLMCKRLPVHTMGEDIFKVIHSYMTDKGLSGKDLKFAQMGFSCCKKDSKCTENNVG
jgi:hypothetical protein